MRTYRHLRSSALLQIRGNREENQALFDFLFESFRQLDSTEHSVANFHISFMLELTGFLGFMPGGSYSEETPCFDLAEGVAG